MKSTSPSRCRNPFQTRSTTSIPGAPSGALRQNLVAIPSKPGQRLQYRDPDPSNQGPASRNPFQTRSTTSIGGYLKPRKPYQSVAIPSKPGQRLQSRSAAPADRGKSLSQSLPNQVNDFNFPLEPQRVTAEGCRNPFQTRSTTSIP